MNGAAANRTTTPARTDAARFSRRGACPALSAPMQTGDGLLVRLNPVASSLSPRQLAGLCAAAERHGNGIVEVTARGGFQIRGLTDASAAALAREVDALGIAVRTGVPVQTGPLAGLDPDEIADPRPLAERIRAGIEDAGLNGKLGAKVSVVVDGGHSGLDEVAADVRLVAIPATPSGADPLWQVSIGGDPMTATDIGLSSREAAADVALNILKAIAALGHDARARDLLAGDRLRSFAPPSGLPAISPSGGEIELPRWFRQSPTAVGEAPTAEPPISPPEGEMAGRPEGGAKERDLSKTRSLDPAKSTTVLPLRDGRFAFAIALPFGQADARDLANLTEAAASAGIHDLRLAPRRTIIILCRSPQAAEDFCEAAAKLGFVTDSNDPRASISACPGSPACASGYMPARKLAASVTKHASDLLDGSVSLHISGCAKGCAHPGASALTLVGTESGIGLVANGTARDTPLAYATNDRAAATLARVALLVASQRKADETASACLDRLGVDRLAQTFSDGE